MPAKPPTRQEAELNAAYAVRGARVLTVLLQNAELDAPDVAFCDDWQSRHGLTNEVLRDAAQQTQVDVADGSPAYLVVDDSGTIVHREQGYSEPFGTLRAQLDELLSR